MENGLIPEYSTGGLASYPILFSSYADLLIYVEDIDGLGMYENLFKRLLGPAISFRNINLAGGKTRLIEMFQATRGAVLPTVFIADLDYDQLKEENMINDERFIYLRRYCIENYLVSEETGICFLNGRANLGSGVCKTKLDFQNWIYRLQKDYVRIILLFAIVQKLGLEMPNTKLCAEKFIRNDSWRIDRNKVDRYLQKARFVYKASGKTDFAKTFLKLKGRLNHLYSPNIWWMIPGKQLLTIFNRYLTQCTQNTYKCCKDDFINLAIHTMNLADLEYIRDRINLVMAKYRKKAGGSPPGTLASEV